jgi:hypothetical protein
MKKTSIVLVILAGALWWAGGPKVARLRYENYAAEARLVRAQAAVQQMGGIEVDRLNPNSSGLLDSLEAAREAVRRSEIELNRFTK